LDTVTIEWGHNAERFENIGRSALSHLDENGFYAILGANPDPTKNQWADFDLLYIGQAFDQTLRQRIPQPHPAYSCVNENIKKTGKTVIVMVGVITEKSVERLTQDFIDDVECCLIYSNQPLCNDKCKDEYNHRSPRRQLRITNKEVDHILEASCSCVPPSDT
jgi:hypothetical protein